jgi:hypothetical protein
MWRREGQCAHERAGHRLAGPPPERHAHRVIGEMLVWLKGESDRRMPGVQRILNETDHLAGSARAQRRFATRLSKAADLLLLGMWLQCGKRGCFRLLLHVWSVDPTWPQIRLGTIAIRGAGNYRVEENYFPLFTVSHHALSRLAQRCEVRTTYDLHTALGVMGAAAMAAGWQFLHVDDYPPAGKRFAFPGGIAVLKRDVDTGELVVATVLESKEEEVQ